MLDDITTADDHSSSSTGTKVNEQNNRQVTTLIHRMEAVVYLIVIVYTLLIQGLVEDTASLIAILVLSGINLAVIFAYKRFYQVALRAGLGVLSVGVLGLISTRMADPATVAVWFYAFVILYSFTLFRRYHYIFMAVAILSWTIAQGFTASVTVTDILPPIIIMIGLGLLGRVIRNVIHNTIQASIQSDHTHDPSHREHHLLHTTIDTIPNQLSDEKHQIMGQVGITSVKDTQNALNQSQMSMQQFQHQLQTLNQIMINLTRIETFDELVYEGINQGVHHLGFSRLNCWFIDRDNPNELVGSYMVNLNGRIIPAHHIRMEVNRFDGIKDIIRGNITNQVMRDTLIYDQEQVEIGHGDKAFTALLDGEKVIGCLYTDNLLDDQPLTDSQVELFISYGATLGVLFNRKRDQEALRNSEETARSFQNRLKILNEVNLTLQQIDDLNEFCKQAVTLGRTRLGFDRMGIWLTVEGEPDKRRGMWGTDQNGNLRDERGAVIEIPEEEKQLIQEDDVIFIPDMQIYDYDTNPEDKVFLREGWLFIGLMRNDDQHVGWLYADNSISGQDYNLNRHELFRLYAANLGVLINRLQTRKALESSQEESRNFQQQLKTLNAVTLELENYNTLDELCRQAVMMGLRQLGFDRMWIWLPSEQDHGMRQGMWGTDQDGNLLDNRHIVQPIPERDAQMLLYEDVVVLHDVALDDFEDQTGWLMTGLMEVGNQPIGWLYADNAINGQPYHPNQHELFRLYLAKLGVLINRYYVQEELRASEEEALNFQQLLKELNQIAIQLESAESLDDLCRMVNVLGREKLGFDRLGIWLIDPQNPEVANGMWGTTPEGNLRDERHLSVKISDYQRTMPFEREINIRYNKSTQLNLDANLQAVGWAMNGFLYSEQKKLGWISVDNAITHQPLTSNRQELFRLYVLTISEHINRYRVQEELRASEEEARNFQQLLKILNEITLQLEHTYNLDELCQKAIEYGREKLGFDRLGIWLTIEDQPDVRRGMWGTDMQGNLRDERDWIVPILDWEDQMTPDADVVLVKDGALYNQDPRLDADSEFVQEGWNLVGLMWDGSKKLGWLFADNAINGQPYHSNQHELFRLYSSTLGVLINRYYVQEELKASEEEALNFQQQLKKLNEVTLLLEATPNLESLCKQSVILGREKLGFDRLGIWIIEEDHPTMYRGTWGTDSAGNLRDERHILIDIPDQQAQMTPDSEVILIRNKQTLEGFLDKELESVDWVLNGLIFDGHERIGWISADNALTNQPLTPNKQELFRLYVATISLLYTRKIADERLREREVFYREITETSSDIILIVNQEFAVTYISPSVNAIIGIDPDAVLGRPVYQIVHEDENERILSILEECIEHPNQTNHVSDFRVKHVDGHWIHMEGILTNRINDPVINGILISCRDLTQRLIAEENKRIIELERQRSQVLRQFLGDISHDFLTPISTISTSLYLIQHGARDQLDRRIDMIKRQLDRLNDLIKNIKTITKLDDVSEISMEKVDINNILDSINYYKTDVIANKEIALEFELVDRLPPLIGNTGLLHDALFQVLDNAIQYTEEQDTITIKSSLNGDYIQIDIIDTGIGISEESLPYVFDRLYRADKSRNTDTGGSGLGLAIVRRIIELHKGKIDIESSLDQGTQVHIQLPFLPS